MELFPYEPYAARAWQLRGQLTAHDAWYVAIAVSLGVPLVTPDRRLARAAAAACAFYPPPK